MLATMTTAQSAQRVTIYGDSGYPPYSFNFNGTIRGIYVEILESAFSRMNNYVVEIKLMPWKRILLGIEYGKFFAIFPPYFRPEQRPWIDVYSAPILEESYSVYCRKEILNNPRPNWPEDYRDLQVGLNLGYAIPEIDRVKNQKATTSIQNIKKLLSGKIDCYANNSKSTLYLLKQLGADTSILKEGTRISTEFGYLAFSAGNNPHYKKDFIEKFNSIITEMTANGEIDSIVKKYLK
jgi:polar amino acid transport system substrate-binding protein